MNELISTKKPLEVWGGVECTVNRVNDHFFDQMVKSGHDSRIEDLQRFKDLGIHTLRYPVLWERTAPQGLQSANWTWADERLGCLQSLEIEPIVGLVHHGSGPYNTSLIDPAFPEKLEQYAYAVAARYPWVQHYTPVNEPLTTARFSGLYGHWYPHGTDASTFARTFITQCRAVVLAMNAIRQVNPQATLVQTEDLGKTFSTASLAYQADFENERRWLTFDLLCGRIDSSHSMWHYLCGAGIRESELGWFLEHPCPPDSLGINYYLTSERFLDDALESYPTHLHGGNGRDRYVDVEAVRVRAAGLTGVGVLLAEAWERYGLPLAITEAHNGCTREEQMRWFVEVWKAATTQYHQGVDVRAVTAWALLGSYDWNSLVTRSDGYYEPGAFDLRAPTPRPTALHHVIKQLATGKIPSHPVLASPGWWHRPERLLYDVSVGRDGSRDAAPASAPFPLGAARPLLITGATGTLGCAFARLCKERGISFQLLTRQEMDISDRASIESALNHWQPWAVVNTAGYVRVAEAEQEKERCYRENTEGPTLLAQLCAQRQIRLVTFSSDLVFDGTKQSPYVESDQLSPLNVYGHSKSLAEEQVLSHYPEALVIRTSAFFGPWDDSNFVVHAVRSLRQGAWFEAIEDECVSPTYTPDLVDSVLNLLIDEEQGIWHLSNQGAVSWAEWARHLAERVNLDGRLVRGIPRASSRPIRPRYSVLGSERGWLLPSLEDAMARFLRDWEMGKSW